MTPDEATRIAQQWLRGQLKRDLPLYSPAERRARNPQEWTVAFENLGPHGEQMDGPIIVVVDDQSAQARFF
jgi:hypothetical protein